MALFGQAEVVKIVDIDPFALPLDFIMPGASTTVLEPHRALLEPHHLDFAAGRILLGVHSLLIRSGGLNILIDACVGEDKQRPRRPDWHLRTGTGYLPQLAAAGLTPEDIDIVLCTHLHADHVGWHTRLDNGRWVPTFANARYLMGGTELAHWQRQEALEPGKHNHGAWRDSVLPVIEAGQAETVEGGFELSAGMRIEALAGHSPGQIGLCLHCGGGRKAIFCGDAIHSPVQVLKPEWTSAFCSDREKAVSTRLDLLERASSEDIVLVPAHLRHARGMTIRRHGTGFEPVFV